jgi:hypothetical protein
VNKIDLDVLNLKLDYEMAYDKNRFGFLMEMLLSKGFGAK